MIAALLGMALAIAPAPAVDTLTDTVFVVTNRRRTATGFTREVSDSLWYGVYVTRNVTDAAAARALAPMQVTAVDSSALDEHAWSERLRAAVRDASARAAALVFVHGYASDPATALTQGVQVRARGMHRGPLIVFLWPAHGVATAVPRLARAYRDDARAAAQSGTAFAHVMRTVDSLTPGAVLVAHSMGSRVALAAIVSDLPTHSALTARPLRAIGLFSPDVGATRFRDAFAPVLPSLAHRVALYGAATDYLLGASVVLNRERRAAAIANRGEPLSGIELIDDTHGARAEPAVLRLFGPRHSVRWASAALGDFFAVVVSGANPSCRVDAGTADAAGEGRWRLRRNVVPSAWLGARCAPIP